MSTPTGSRAEPQGPVTYGELLDITTTHLTQATLALAVQPPLSAGGVARTVVAYREVVNAFGAHITGVLADRSRMMIVDDATHETIVQSGLLKAALQSAVPVRPLDLPQDRLDSVIGQYRAAARALRAASDLLATHTDPATALGRSPESGLLRYLGERGPMLRRLAGMVAVTAEHERLLRRLAEDVQARGERVGVGLPDLSTVRDTAHAIAGERLGAAIGREDLGGEAPVFERATVARPTVRTGDPLVEFRDRVAAIRLAAWELLRDPEPSLQAAADVARLATHIEATRFRLTAHRGAPLTAMTAPKAGAWHQVWTELRQLRGLTRPHSEIRQHARALEHLIGRQTRHSGEGSADVSQAGAAVSPGSSSINLGDLQHRRELAAVLRHAGDQLAETAPWSHTTLDRLAQADQLFVAGSPAEVGEGTLSWHAGKPVWAPAPMPQDKSGALKTAYRRLEGAYAESVSQVHSMSSPAHHPPQLA